MSFERDNVKGKFHFLYLILQMEQFYAINCEYNQNVDISYSIKNPRLDSQKPVERFVCRLQYQISDLASLDFGVFLCSNCSGAHRALGPTITRVRSTKLDSWNQSWVQNMKIGNKQINDYWQFQNSHAQTKPKPGASLEQINRYVVQKYLKKKFANSGKHPLQAYKDGEYEVGSQEVNQTAQKQVIPTKNTKPIKPLQKPENIVSEIKVIKTSYTENLLDDIDHHHQHYSSTTVDNSGSISAPSLSVQHIQVTEQTVSAVQDDDQDQFTEYTSGDHHPNHHENSAHNNLPHSPVTPQQVDHSNLSYEQLIKKHSSTSTNSNLSHHQQHGCSGIAGNLYMNHGLNTNNQHSAFGHSNLNLNGNMNTNGHLNGHMNGHMNGHLNGHYQPHFSAHNNNANYNHHNMYPVHNSNQNGHIPHSYPNQQLNNNMYQNNNNNAVSMASNNSQIPLNWTL